MKKTGLIIIFFISIIYLIIATSLTYAQDTTWQQVLGGWVDDVYYENLFLGGSYFTRISLADIDSDGDLDMFYGGGDCGTLVFFENVGSPQTPFFEFRLEEFRGLRHPSIYGGAADVDFADLDGDGDLDAAFSDKLEAGGMVLWNDGDSINPNFVYRYPLGPLDGQSNVTLVDIDNDGDMDYFSGAGFRDFEIYFAENTGTIYEPNYVMVTRYYQNLSFFGGFNFDFGDLDLDGDYDLIVCKYLGTISYYENTGTPSSAQFTLITDNLLPYRDTTDWWETPELADIDADGDLDLFLAGEYAHLFYFENQGIGAFPQFEQIYDTLFFYLIPRQGGTALNNSVDLDGDGDDDLTPGTSLFLNESTNDEIKYSRIDHVLPFTVGSFVDIDADGDYDYLTPGGHSTIGYYENINDSTWPIWSNRMDLFPPDGRLQDIFTVNAGDIDADGDYDILVGHANSQQVDLYKNIGTPAVYDFNYNGYLNLPQWEYHGAFTCLLEDIDNDNDLDLFIGDKRNSDTLQLRLLFYRNDGTPLQHSFTFITEDFQNIITDHRNGNMGPSFSDVDKDGDRDLVSPVHLGLMLYLNPDIQTDVRDDNPEASTLPRKPFTIQCYPNPFNSAVTISIGNASTVDIIIEIYDILGRFRESLKINDNSAIWNP